MKSLFEEFGDTYTLGKDGMYCQRRAEKTILRRVEKANFSRTEKATNDYANLSNGSELDSC